MQRKGNEVFIDLVNKSPVDQKDNRWDSLFCTSHDLIWQERRKGYDQSLQARWNQQIWGTLPPSASEATCIHES